MERDKALALVNDLYQALQERLGEVNTLNAYYRGKQPLRFASEKWRNFHSSRYAGFSDNWCAPVADAPSERQRIENVRVTDLGDSADEKQLWNDWLRNEGDAQSSQGFLQSVIARRSFVLVWGGADGEPAMTWESPAQVIVGYDPERPTRRTAALKVWLDGENENATLYTPDEVWKFSRRVGKVKVQGGFTESGIQVVGSSPANMGGGQWVQRQPQGDDSWPLRNPLGLVPIVEFPNRPMLGGQPVSDISGTKAMQDAINLLWAYLFGAADHASFPARVVMGTEAPKVPVLDSNGQKVGERTVDIKDLEQGRFLWLTGQNAKIGQWDAAKLDVFTQVIEIAVGHIAAQTRTPPHYLVTNKGLANLSGDALVAAETGLVKKVEEQQLYFSAAVREVFRLMALVRGNRALADSMRSATVQWQNPAMRSDAQMVDALMKRRELGYPLAYLMELEGKGATEIDRIMAMIRAEGQDPYLAAVAAKEQADGAPAGAAVGGE